MRDPMKAAKRHRRRAQEARLFAHEVTHGQARQILMQIADEYEQWAIAAESEGRETSRGVFRNSIRTVSS